MWCALDMTYGESWHKTITCYDSLSYYIAWTLNLERILSLCQNQQEALTYGWDLKVVIYPYELGCCWWRLLATCILDRGTMISHGIETVCPLRWSKGHVIIKYVAIVIPIVEFDDQDNPSWLLIFRSLQSDDLSGLLLMSKGLFLVYEIIKAKTKIAWLETFTTIALALHRNSLQSS